MFVAQINKHPKVSSSGIIQKVAPNLNFAKGNYNFPAQAQHLQHYDRLTKISDELILFITR